MLPSASDYQILEHFVRFWSQPTRILDYKGALQIPPGPIFVAEFPPDVEGQSWAYATIGASRYAMLYSAEGNNEQSERRLEIFMYSNEPTDELVYVLTCLALYPFVKKTILKPGDRIPGDEEGFIKSSPLTDFLFLPPLNEARELSAVHINENQQHVDILWAVPIYKSERQFINENGWKELVKLFIANKLNSADFLRPPVV
jgi:hypothetical protein